MRTALLVACSAAVIALSACSGGQAPLTVSREALGTVVTVSAWGDDRTALADATDSAFAEMAAVETEADPYTKASAVAESNSTPYEWHPLPPAAIETLDRVAALGVGTWFSPALFGVTRLYDFGGRGSVPTTVQLSVALLQADAFSRDGVRARFARAVFDPPASDATAAASLAAATRPGLDFGGSAKGIALDRAMRALRRATGIEGAMISAGSSTLVWGRKPDGEPWRVGIEDPRRTGSVVAVVSAQAPDVLSVSTSGDYQQYFERGGVRYHHILDPATGRPARGLRSLTVFGDMTGLDADVLSTALFVMGPDAAEGWARRRGLGLYAIDDRGRVIAVPAPEGAGIGFERTAAPLR